jgi:hypothetical protein
VSPKSGYSDDAQEKHDSHIKKFFCLEIMSCSLSCLSFLGEGVIKHLSPFSPENRIYYITFSINWFNIAKTASSYIAIYLGSALFFLILSVFSV